MQNSMNNTHCFIPLNSTSQSGADNVLYYDSHTSVEALYETATARLEAVYSLLECLFEFKNPPENALSVIAVASTLLLSDTMSLLPILNPQDKS